MKLEDLYTNILDMDTPHLLSHIVSYTNQRTTDLSKPSPRMVTTTVRKPTTKKKSAGAGAGNIAVTADQLELLRKLKLI